MKVLIFVMMAVFLQMRIDGSIHQLLCQLQQRSQESHSDAVLVLRHGKPVFSYYSKDENALIDIQDMTKSLMGLAVSLMLDEGKIPCLDLSLSTFYPQWNRGVYKTITIGSLLNNTSGLISSPSLKNYESCFNEDLLMTFPPGSGYQNHPESLVLIENLIKKITGKPFYDYLSDRLFCPLGINKIQWKCDQEKKSLPHLFISAYDLAKVGYLISNKGIWKDQQIISERRLREMFSPSQKFNPFFGLQWDLEFYDLACWWDSSLLDLYEENGVAEDLILKLARLQGRVIHFGGKIYDDNEIHLTNENDIFLALGGKKGISQLLAETQGRNLPFARFKGGLVKSFTARGKGGQQLIIMPHQGLVAVRQKQFDGKLCFSDTLDDLSDWLVDYAKECDCYID